MREVTYTDPDGRMFLVRLPNGVPDSEASRGAPIGPPPLDELKLPFTIEVRLHNALFARGLLTPDDVRRRPNEVAAAIMYALKLDAQAVMALY